MTPEQAIVPPFLRRVVIRDYKSIAICDAWLKPRTLLVGRNGAGKSNFLDALHFVADALQTSLDQAVNKRGGADLVFRQTPQPSGTLAIRLEFGLPYHLHGEYEIELAGGRGKSLTLLREYVRVYDSSGRERSSFLREKGELVSMRTWASETPLMPPPRRDRLYLVNAAVLPDFQAPFELLTSMAFYNLNVDAMRRVDQSEADELLTSDGSNVARVLKKLEERDPEAIVRINEYLANVVPEIKRVTHISLGSDQIPARTVLAFIQQADAGRMFAAAAMSDGTMRVLGILLAANQIGPDGLPPRLIGIEEPEAALHPAAAASLMDALGEAASHTHVILTTHSADLLDQLDLANDALLVVESHDGTSRVTTVNQASTEAIKKHLYSPGDLLRMDQLQLNRTDYDRQLQLVGTPGND